MAAIIIPLVALAIIIAILVLAWPRRPAPGRPPRRDAEVTPPLTQWERDALTRNDRLICERRFDRTPFGEDLARRMWRAIARARIGDGIIPNQHREYCGHGLVRTATGGVALHEVHDSDVHGMPVLASWEDEESFVAFFARQSNYSVNGYDPAEPVFYTEDAWARGNQRLVRQDIEAVLRSLP